MRRNQIVGLGLAAMTALFTMTACGETQVESGTAEHLQTESQQTENSQADNSRSEGSSGENSAAPSVGASAPSADGTVGNIFADSSVSTPAPYEGELTGFTVALPSKDLHTKKNSLHDRLLQEMNAYTGLEITWEWYEPSSYEAQLVEWMQAGNVPDLILTDRSETFLNAAAEGLFWEIGPYIDEYNHLATMSDICRAGGYVYGKMYGIPQKGKTADWGLTYRGDWLQKLGLAEPTDWESFCEMLYAFTYNDPDGNGVDDTVGLVLDVNYTEIFEAMESWFGVPNSWGVDENGDLIHKSQTTQYRTAYAAFRELYASGLMNNGNNGVEEFRELKGEATNGMEALRSEYKNSRAGCTVSWLYNMCGVWKNMVEEGTITEEEDFFTLQSSVDTGYGELVYPLSGDGVGEMLAISTTRIKDVEQMKQVLGAINALCDGEILTKMLNGWEGEHYLLDENGYFAEDTGMIISNELLTFSQGIWEVAVGYSAEKNRGIPMPKWQGERLWQVREQLMQENEKNCVINAAYQFMNVDEISKVQEMEELLSEAELQYIIGEIDEAAFEEALTAWMENGGEAMTRQLNEKYHAAGF